MSICILTFADAHFCAAHRDRLTGAMHGHTWKVRAYWLETDHRKDAIVLQNKLRETLKAFDHRELESVSPHMEASNEGVAAALLHLLDCARVDVWRDAEGIGATVEVVSL